MGWGKDGVDGVLLLNFLFSKVIEGISLFI